MNDARSADFAIFEHYSPRPHIHYSCPPSLLPLLTRELPLLGRVRPCLYLSNSLCSFCLCVSLSVSICIPAFLIFICFLPLRYCLGHITIVSRLFFVCLSVCQSICLSVDFSVCFTVFLSVYLPVFLSSGLAVSQFSCLLLGSGPEGNEVP